MAIIIMYHCANYHHHYQHHHGYDYNVPPCRSPATTTTTTTTMAMTIMYHYQSLATTTNTMAMTTMYHCLGHKPPPPPWQQLHYTILPDISGCQHHCHHKSYNYNVPHVNTVKICIHSLLLHLMHNPCRAMIWLVYVVRYQRL